MERWATFDCYGTLVDWNGGIRAELEKLFGVEDAEPEIQAANPGCSYREVLTVALERLAEEATRPLPEGETNALARSLPSWPVFPDVRPALEEARGRGWRLAILSNTDRDLIDASIAAIGIPFGAAIVAGDLGSYKPAPRHWEAFREHTRVQPEAHVHVAQSLYHDVGTATELGIPSIWINRLGEPPDPRPCATLSSLTGLADALDEIVPG